MKVMYKGSSTLVDKSTIDRRFVPTQSCEDEVQRALLRPTADQPSVGSPVGARPAVAPTREDGVQRALLGKPAVAPTAPSRGGMVLVVVLIVVAMLALAGFTFTELMFTEHKAAHITGQNLQTRAILESGVTMLALECEKPRESRFEASATGATPTFHDVPVLRQEATGLEGYYTIAAPTLNDEAPGELSVGPQNESARLNLPALVEWDRVYPDAARDALLALPGMTPQIADALLDWVDADKTQRPNGAEGDYYSGLDPPYAPRNGVPESMEELLLVRGVTRELLFGDDSQAPAAIGRSPIASQRFSAARPQSDAPRGWIEYLTLYSAEQNLSSSGQPRVNVNDTNLESLYSELSKILDRERAGFIIAYRQYGPNQSGKAADGQLPDQPDFSQPATQKLYSLVDLVDASVEMTPSGASAPIVVASPFRSDSMGSSANLVEAFDRIAITHSASIPGRVNVNEAPRIVLEALPDLSPSQIDAITAARNTGEGNQASRRHAIWLLAEGIATREQMRKLMPLVTATGDVYRAQVMAYLSQQPRVARAEVIIDATSGSARVLSWKDLPPVSVERAQRLLGAATSRSFAATHQP